MAAGDMKRLDKRQHAKVEAAVARAEATTGLQFCVFLGSIDDAHPRDHAEAMFVEAGLHDRPGLLIVVAPKQRRVEIVTSPHIRARVSDADAASAVEAMTASFGRGDLAGGLVSGLDRLTAIAGPGRLEAGQVNITDVVDDDTDRP